MSFERLDESSTTKKNGVLASYKATFMQFNKVNENNRIYPSEIAKNKILTEKTMQAIKDNKLLGEINHPKDRFDVDFEKVAINTTSLYYDEDSDSIKGTFDILDTPMGRILKTLVDYGTHISISARAMGKTRSIKGTDEVLEEGYIFKTFDSVTDPGFSIATIDPSKDAIHESLKNVYESFSADEKTQVSPLLESIGMSTDFLYDSIGSQASEINDNQSLSEDNSEIQSLIDEYENIIAILKTQVDDKDSSIESIQEEYNTIIDMLKDSSASMEESLNIKIDEFMSVIDTLTESLKTSERSINDLTSKLEESYNINKSLKEGLTNTIKMYTDASISTQSLMKDNSDNLSMLQEELNESKSKYNDLLKEYKLLEIKYAQALKDLNNAELKNKKVEESLSFKINESSISKGNDFTLINVINESNQNTSVKEVDSLTSNLLKKLK